MGWPCTGGPGAGAAPPRLTLAEVLRAALPGYGAAHRLPAHHWKVLNAILACRTPRLGGHVYHCLDCGREHFVPHSCRNRHCPQCQKALADDWLAVQMGRLLPIPYVHVVFTVPHALNPLCERHPRPLYNLLFAAASQTLLSFGEQRFGGQIGLSCVLHTWSQTLGGHYHLHCIVTGGGLSRDGQRWRAAGRNYLFKVANLSAVFRGKFLEGLERLWKKGALEPSPPGFPQLLAKARRPPWVVYVKRPFAGPEQVLRYLGRYTHRVAISQRRLLALDRSAGRVTFAYKDYADGSRPKTMSLALKEFTRRFLLHILPERFVKIRHYGLLGNRDREAHLRLARARIASAAEEAEAPSPASPPEPAAATTGGPEPEPPRKCPHCGSPRLELARVEPATSAPLDSS
jgi:DNA-directed RNA polymerase subunit RPC12/RpoP